MGFKKGLEWNQNQMLAAFHLTKGKTIPETVKETGFKYRFVHKIKQAMDSGDKPPSLDEKAIKNAPPPSKFGKHALPKGKADEVTPATVTEDKGKPKEVLSGKLKFFGTLIECEYTPVMMLARQAASEEWKWDPNIRFEDFMDTILYHFFKDRGITLQGYIVDEKVGA